MFIEYAYRHAHSSLCAIRVSSNVTFPFWDIFADFSVQLLSG